LAHDNKKESLKMTKCNGWKNRETWLVNLWFGDNFTMDAEEGIEITPDYIREVVEQHIENERGKDWSGFVYDMMNLNVIDYDELASHHTVADEDGEEASDA